MKKQTAENPDVTISVLFRIKEGLKKLPPNSVGTVYVAGDVGKIALQVAKDLNIIQDIKKEIIAGRPAGLHKFSNGLVFATVTGIHPTGLLNSHFKPETQQRQDEEYTMLAALLLCEFETTTSLAEMFLGSRFVQYHRPT